MRGLQMCSVQESANSSRTRRVRCWRKVLDLDFSVPATMLLRLATSGGIKATNGLLWGRKNELWEIIELAEYLR